ncbi:MAG TPA: Hsp70 family protein, partial [Candidatus Methylacidiphilales bacterium]|nr:Hsp70 family protein [Candidatus Methylacidiphilales bacterium]
MAQPLYSIGIDLGTTNCAVAYAPLDDARATSLTLPLLQWETPTAMAEFSALPSFLWLPTDAERDQLRGKSAAGGAEEWVVGRLARHQAALTPERVVHSAKSWLGHHAVDRAAAFLPWGTDAVAAAKKISPIRAAALLLNYIQSAWDQKFASEGSGALFASQEITITVPASFDAAAQRLTLEAARSAGFPDRVRLLEEPQAAFYRWLEQHEADGATAAAPPTSTALSNTAAEAGAAPSAVADAAHAPATPGALQKLLPELKDRRQLILVVDIGGGTSDFSLFDIAQEVASAAP